MWTHEHTEQTDLAPQDIWAALRAVHIGAVPAAGGDTFEIHGPFAVGTQISVTPQGQDTFTSTITELDEPHRYADRTEYGDVVLTFRHTLAALDGGAGDDEVDGTRVTHELVIDGPGADAVGPELGPQITADFPAALAGLIAVARELAAADAQ